MMLRWSCLPRTLLVMLLLLHTTLHRTFLMMILLLLLQSTLGASLVEQYMLLRQ